MKSKPPPLESAMFGDLPLQEKPRPPDERRALDFYPTGPREAIRALLRVESRALSRFKTVWEPAAGVGDMAEEIMGAGFGVFSTDIAQREYPLTEARDFFDYTEPLAPAIISNPPYDQINARDGGGRWLRHTIDLGVDYAAYLLSWDWPAARKNGLGELLACNPFSYCYLCRWKIDFTGGGAPPQRNAWFVWNRHEMQTQQIRFLDREDGRQGELFGEGEAK